MPKKTYIETKNEKDTEETNEISENSALDIPASTIILENYEDISNSFKKSGRAGLLRLFESPYCEIGMTINYFCSINEPGITDYIGNKLFSYTSEDVNSYLLQLVHMYLYVEHAEKILFENLRRISSTNLNSSLIITWLLETYLLQSRSPAPRQMSSLRHLLNSILVEKCQSKYGTEPDSIVESSSSICDTAPSSILYFTSERSFVSELVLISRRLKVISFKFSRIHRLHSELLTLDRTLYHPVFVPILSAPDHIIVRIPYKDSSVLNSKEKAPYLVYIEVIEKPNALSFYSNLMKLKENEAKKHFNASLRECDTLSDFSFEPCQPSISFDEGNESRDNNKPDNLPKCEDEDSIEFPGWNKITIGKVRENLEKFEESTQNSVNGIDASDPSASVIFEPWKKKFERIKSSSPYGHIEGWNLYSIIVKYGDDLRQDHLAYQFLKKCMDIWEMENVPLWVRPYAVVITESTAGIIEAITDAISIHQIKNKNKVSLSEYFKQEFGHSDDAYFEAKKNFIQSLAGYSLFQYIFQVKDRHNGNILLDLKGHIIHIDFGFILGQSPKSISFETSPFKMTPDFIELLDGIQSDLFLYFKSLMLHGLIALRKHMNKLMVLVEVFKTGNYLACLGKNGQNIESLRRRFHDDLNDTQTMNLIDKLVYQSTSSLTTMLYDKFQYYTNGIVS